MSQRQHQRRRGTSDREHGEGKGAECGMCCPRPDPTSLECLHCSARREEAVLTTPAPVCDPRKWREGLPQARVTEDLAQLVEPRSGANVSVSEGRVGASSGEVYPVTLQLGDGAFALRSDGVVQKTSVESDEQGSVRMRASEVVGPDFAEASATVKTFIEQFNNEPQVFASAIGADGGSANSTLKPGSFCLQSNAPSESVQQSTLTGNGPNLAGSVMSGEGSAGTISLAVTNFGCNIAALSLDGSKAEIGANAFCEFESGQSNLRLETGGGFRLAGSPTFTDPIPGEPPQPLAEVSSDGGSSLLLKTRGGAGFQAGDIDVLSGQNLNLQGMQTATLNGENTTVAGQTSLALGSGGPVTISAPAVSINPTGAGLGFFGQGPVPRQGAGGAYTLAQVVAALQAYGLLN